MKILDWKALANEIKSDLKKKIKKENINAHLAIILIWENQASQIYVGNKIKSCEEIWIKTSVYDSDTISQEDLINKIHELNSDKEVHWILVQLPLPENIFVPDIIRAIDPKKDVDWFTAYNVWKMFASTQFEDLPPATPAWIIKLLEKYNIEIQWKNAVVIWHSNIVWKPIATMLLNRNATVSICHIHTKDLSFYTKNADILISATWVVWLVNKDMIKPWAILIDVWTNKNENWKMVWDIDFENVAPICSYISPVPWWVWPMTIAMLLINTIKAFERQYQ